MFNNSPLDMDKLLRRLLQVFVITLLSIIAIVVAVHAAEHEIVYDDKAQLEGTHHLGNILHHNKIQYGLDDEEFTIETPYGNIVLNLDRTWNKDCNNLCPDTVTVISTPPGTVVIPSELTTPELSTGTMKFYRFIGG